MKHSYNIQALGLTKLRCCLLVLVSLILGNCGGVVPGNAVTESPVRFPTPTIASALMQPETPVPVSATPAAAPSSAVTNPGAAQGTVIRVDSSQNVHPI